MTTKPGWLLSGAFWLAGGHVRVAILLVMLAAPSMVRAESQAEARARIEQMDADEKDQLRRKQAQFVGLDESKQKQLVRLHQDIESAPDRDQLLQTMERYSDWLATLSAGERADLLDLPLKERAERIAKMRRKEAAEAAKLLPQADHKVVQRWLQRIASSHRKELLDHAPEWVRRRLESLDEAKRVRELGDVLVMRARFRPEPPMFDERDFEKLTPRLTQKSQQQLLAAETIAEKQQVVVNWMLAHLEKQQPAADVSDEELIVYFDEKLKPEERDWLLSLPPEQMQRQIRFHYMFSQWAGGRGRGGRSGSGVGSRGADAGRRDRENREQRPGPAEREGPPSQRKRDRSTEPRDAQRKNQPADRPDRSDRNQAPAETPSAKSDSTADD